MSPALAVGLGVRGVSENRCRRGGLCAADRAASKTTMVQPTQTGRPRELGCDRVIAVFGIVALGPFGTGPHGYFGAAMGYLRAQFALERPLRPDGCGRCRALGSHGDDSLVDPRSSPSTTSTPATATKSPKMGGGVGQLLHAAHLGKGSSVKRLRAGWRRTRRG
jgi:hypothetical protein